MLRPNAVCFDQVTGPSPRLTVSARISAFNITGTLQTVASPCDALGPRYLTPRNPTPLIVSIKCPSSWSLSFLVNHCQLLTTVMAW